MKRNKKNIWLTVAIVALCATTAFGQNENDTISPFVEMQRVTETFRYNPLLSYGDQMRVIGRETDTRTSIERDKKGNITITQDARTLYGWTIGLGLGADFDVKAKDKEVHCFGPVGRVYGSYYGPWYEFGVNLEFTRQANPLQEGETYWGWGFHFNPKFFLARWPKDIDYNVFYIDGIIGVQQAKTAASIFYEDENVTVDFTEDNKDFTYAMGGGIGYQRRFFAQGYKLGVQLDFITYGGVNTNKVAHNGQILVDKTEKIRMFQPRLTIYFGFTLGRRAASQKTYSAQQWAQMVEASKLLLNEK